MLMMFVAETKVTCDIRQSVACSTANVVTSSLDNSTSDMSCHKPDAPASASSSDLIVKDDCHSVAEWLVMQHSLVIIITDFFRLMRNKLKIWGS